MGYFWEILPQIECLVTDIPSAYYYLVASPICWSVRAPDIDESSQGQVVGRFDATNSEVQGQPIPQAQDTYINGSTGKTGRAFTIVQGTAKDDWVNPRTGQYGILFGDSTSGQAFEAVSVDTTALIEAAQIVIGRGYVPVVASPTAQNTNAYLHFAYQSATDYRLAFEWGNPVRLDYSSNGGATWQPVQQLRGLGNAEWFLRARDHEVTINVLPDNDRGQFAVEVGYGNWLRHAPTDDTGAAVGLPSPGNIRFVGQNGWASLEYNPHKFASLSAQSPILDTGTTQPNAGEAFVQINSLTIEASSPTTGDTQQDTTSVLTDGQRFAFLVSSVGPDADANNLSAQAPRFSDGTLVLPALWADAVPSDDGLGYIPNGQVDQLLAMRVEETQVFDDASRSFKASARVTSNNWQNVYSGVQRNFAAQLITDNGSGVGITRITGVGGVGLEGHCLVRHDPTRLYAMPIVGKEAMMQIPLGQEVIFDGWCLFSAVRYLAEVGNINSDFLQNIPLYIPDGAPSYAPYGPAGSDCPYLVLPQGNGLNARYRYLPDDTPWNILQRLAQDSGDVASDGTVLPYYYGFRNDGQLLFAAYDPTGLTGPGLPVKAQISDHADLYAPSQLVVPILDIQVFNSTAQMRSSVTFKGLNPFTNQSTQIHVEQSAAVKAQIGYRYDDLERNIRYADDTYTLAVATTGAQAASIPTLTAIVKTPYLPQVFAGDVVWIEDEVSLDGYFLNGSMYATVLRHQSQLGLTDLSGSSGAQEGFSYLICRYLANY